MSLIATKRLNYTFQDTIINHIFYCLFKRIEEQCCFMHSKTFYMDISFLTACVMFRDNVNDIPEDNYENRKKGWRRMVQFGFYFFPSQINVVPFPKAISDASNIAKKGSTFQKELGTDSVPFNLYPWKWKDSIKDKKNFNALTQNGKLIVPPT